MSQKGPTNRHTSCDVTMMSQHGSRRSNQSLKWANFFCVLCSKLLRCLFKVPVITLLQRLKDVGLIYVSVVTSLRRVKLVTLTQVPVGTSLQRLKLVGFIYVTVRRRKDVSNRSASLTYQLRRRDDVLAWSATSQPIWDVATTLHAGWVLSCSLTTYFKILFKDIKKSLVILSAEFFTSKYSITP